MATSTDGAEENQKLLYRLSLAEEHRILQLEGKGDSKEAQKIMSKIRETSWMEIVFQKHEKDFSLKSSHPYHSKNKICKRIL